MKTSDTAVIQRGCYGKMCCIRERLRRDTIKKLAPKRRRADLDDFVACSSDVRRIL